MSDRQQNNSQSLSKMPHPARQLSAAEADFSTGALTVQQVLGQISLIQQIMGAAMKDGEHYGRIPGCGDKPALLKAGAEKLCLTFRLAPTFDVDERTMDAGHREYRVQCSLTSILSGAFIGQGVGVGSTMEGKYRYRNAPAVATENPVPRAYWDLRAEDPAKAQELIGGKGFTVKKLDGRGWFIAKGGEKTEHDNPADHYNTVLKMAKKRALVDAVLTATAASDIFTQDLEDIAANIAAHTPTAAPVGLPAPQADPVPVQAPEPIPAPSPAASPVPSPVQPSVDDQPPTDFRQVRVHFGKNRGLMLEELNPQQIHWYETDWLPKKETSGGPASVEDVALINALRAFKRWRENQPRGRAK